MTNFDKTLTEAHNGHSKSEGVELVVVLAGHQVFGLLMSQVINIVRPGASGLQVLKLPEPPTGRLYGEVIYRNETLRVVELSRQLLLPLVEPIERSKILLTGQFQKDGPPQAQFGVAIDDIVTLQRVNKADLRLLPGWLCQRLGKLVWGAVLIAPAALTYERTNLEFQNSALPMPFQLGTAPVLATETSIFNVSQVGQATANQVKAEPESKPTAPRASLNLAERLSQRERKVEQLVVDNRRPLILLDIQALQNVAYPEIYK